MFEKNFYCVSSRVENSGQLYGCFKIGPFFGHQSLTFANALRRTLLADRNRCTFDAIQISGVEHEFSSLIGVRESVIDILLNLEKLNFQITKPITKPQVAFLNFCGPGILRAQHLHLPSSFKCIVPEQYIATLEMNGRLTFKLFFSPNWDKFQYNIQNQLWNKNTYEQTWNRPLPEVPSGGSVPEVPLVDPFLLSSQRTKGCDTEPEVPPEGTSGSPRLEANNGERKYHQHPRKIQKKIDRQNIKTNLNYFLKHRPILQKKIRQTMNLPARDNPSIHTTFNNRLKIIHYLTNTLFSSNQDHLQLLLVQFQFWHRVQHMPNLASSPNQRFLRKVPLALWDEPTAVTPLGVFAKKVPLYEKLVKYRTQNFSFHQKNGAHQTRGSSGRYLWHQRWAKYFLLKSKNKQIEKKKLAFLKTRSKIKKQKVPGFKQKIRENFLFLKSSFCTIEKVNYTLQSFDFRSNLTSTEKTIKNTTFDNIYQAHPKQRGKAGQNYSVENLNKKPSLSCVPEDGSRPRSPLDLNCTLKLNALGNEYPISQSEGTRVNSCTHWAAQNQTNTGSKIKLLTSKKKEFILFEVWTNGSLHPQTAILNAINELLFEIFPYSLQISKYEKVQSITSHKSRSLKRREVTDLSRKHFREKFLNLEIGNFHFDLETYLFLKKIKIYRIIDFINFFSKKRDQRTKITGKNTILEKNFEYPLDTIRSLQSIQYTTKIKMTLYKFQIFIYSVLTIDPVIQSSSQKSKPKG